MYEKKIHANIVSILNMNNHEFCTSGIFHSRAYFEFYQLSNDKTFSMTFLAFFNMSPLLHLSIISIKYQSPCMYMQQ